jgi:Gas vesicle protein
MSSQDQAISAQRDVALVEVLDRALGAGVVITGDLTLSLADIDLVYVNLRLLVGSVGTINGERAETGTPQVLALGGSGDGPA